MNLPNSRICVKADQDGFKYVESHLASLKKLVPYCAHRISNDKSWVLEDAATGSEYSKFGTYKFFRLMHLKWSLIQEALAEQSDDPYVIFTDLDVFWAKEPPNIFHNQRGKDILGAIQVDPRMEKENFFCPGIMFWKRTSASQKVLTSIQSYHADLMQVDKSLADDKALNMWLNIDDHSKYICGLDRYQYIIGHRLPQLLLGISHFKLENFTAFHANYAVGLEKKARNIDLASLKIKPILPRIKGILTLLIERAFPDFYPYLVGTFVNKAKSNSHHINTARLK